MIFCISAFYRNTFGSPKVPGCEQFVPSAFWLAHTALGCATSDRPYPRLRRNRSVFFRCLWRLSGHALPSVEIFGTSVCSWKYPTLPAHLVRPSISRCAILLDPPGLAIALESCSASTARLRRIKWRRDAISALKIVAIADGTREFKNFGL